MRENGGDKHAEKAGRSNSPGLFMHSPKWMRCIYPSLYLCLSHQQSSPPTCSCAPSSFLLLLHSKCPGEPRPPAIASPSNTHFTLPVPHMNNTWPDSLCWVNESIASTASETLMASQRRPLTGARLATRCPRCRVMNYGSSFSALFCDEGDRTWVSAARLIFKHTHLGALRLWCKVNPTAVCTWAWRRGYRREHAYEGRFNWYFYACVNKHPAEYLIVAKVVRRCTFLP